MKSELLTKQEAQRLVAATQSILKLSNPTQQELAQILKANPNAVVLVVR